MTKRREPDKQEPVIVAPRSQEPQQTTDKEPTENFENRWYVQSRVRDDDYLYRISAEIVADSNISAIEHFKGTLEQRIKPVGQLNINDCTVRKLKPDDKDFIKTQKFKLKDYEVTLSPRIAPDGKDWFHTFKEREINETDAVSKARQEFRTIYNRRARAEYKVTLLDTKKNEKPVTPKVEPKKWFCEFNIKLGTERYRKGIIVENVDNEQDARREMDIYIKRNFTKIRSVTKVTIVEWTDQQEFSEEIKEKAPKVVISQPVEIKESADDIINKYFKPEELNERVILVVAKPNKVRAKDFESNFFIKPDNGESDDEMYEKFSKSVWEDFGFKLKRKNFATKRTTFKNALLTQNFKRGLLKNSFKEHIKAGASAQEALVMSMAGVESLDQLKKEKESIKKEFAELLDSLAK